MVYLCIALIMIVSQSSDPQVLTSKQETLDFSKQAVRHVEKPQPLSRYTASDGQELHYRLYSSAQASDNLIVLLHGSGWHGLAFDQMAKGLSQAGVGTVVVPDLRGHGGDPAVRGDLSYIGQFEQDVHDLIVKLRQPEQKVTLIGHSSGGGLAIRYAGGAFASDVAQTVLLAPFLKYNAPTMRANSGGWARPLTRRIVGLSMLNTVGITLFNHLPVIDFAFPQEILDGPLGHTATQSYSFRLNQSFAPRGDYLLDVSKLPRFLLLVGEKDEAFLAHEFEPTMSAASDKGNYVVLEGLSHLDILYSDEFVERIGEFVDGAGAQ